MLMTINYATSAEMVSSAKLQAQASLRDVLRDMTNEIQLAAKKDNTVLNPPVKALSVVSPTQIVFQIPADSLGSTWSTPITYQFVNEDTGRGSATKNGLLDTGEDANNDKALTRCITRTQGGKARVIAAANNLSNVQFALNGTKDVLTITVSASKATNNRRHDLISVTASSQVYLQN
jgi:hypothetical protein